MISRYNEKIYLSMLRSLKKSNLKKEFSPRGSHWGYKPLLGSASMPSCRWPTPNKLDIRWHFGASLSYNVPGTVALDLYFQGIPVYTDICVSASIGISRASPSTLSFVSLFCPILICLVLLYFILFYFSLDTCLFSK